MPVTIFEDGANGRLNNRIADPFDVGNAGAPGDGVADAYLAFRNAAQTLGTSGSIYVPPGTYRIGTNLTINCGIIFANGATVKPDSGVTLTLAGPVTTAPGAPIVADGTAGTVTITGEQNGGQWFDVRVFGAVGNDVADDTDAINRAIAAASLTVPGTGGNPLDDPTATAGVPVYFPSGYTFRVASVVDIPNNVPLIIDGTIKATSSMAALIRYSLTTRIWDGYIKGVGVIDCNELASIGIDVRLFAHFSIDGITVLRPGLKGIRLGDPTAVGTSYSGHLTNIYIHRRRAHAAVPSGSIGIHAEYAGDNMLSNIVVIGSETGIKHDLNNNRNVSVHCWSFADTGPTQVAFDDNGNGNDWIACYADTPSVYGFRLRKFNSRIIGGTVYIGQFGGLDNTTIGVWHDQATAFNTIVGLHFYGSAANLRIARDIDGSGSLASVIFHSCQYTNVVVTTPPQYQPPATFQIRNGNLELWGSAGNTARNVSITTNGTTRWRVGSDGASESGSNAGSGLRIAAHDDAGVFLYDVLNVPRNTGIPSLPLGVKIGGGTTLTNYISQTASWDPPSLPTATQQSTTVAVTGASPGDICSVSFNVGLEGTRMWAEVSSSNVVTVYHRNDTGVTRDLATGTLRVAVWKH